MLYLTTNSLEDFSSGVFLILFQVMKNYKLQNKTNIL